MGHPQIDEVSQDRRILEITGNSFTKESILSKDNNEEDDIEDPLSLQQQQQTDEKEYQERVKLLKRKINKADKSIKKDDDPKKVKKMEGKRKEYQAELDELLTKTKS